MAWIKRKDGSMGEGDEDIEFKPEKLKEDISKEVDTKLKDQFTAFSTANDEKMKPLLDMAASLKADREAREAAARKATEEKNKESSAITSEDFMLDPLDAVRRSQEPLTNAVKMLAARTAIRETLENKDYYHGDVKNKVEAMLAQQTLDAQMRPDVIENCYKVVMFDYQKDITEGKLKSRSSAMVFDGGGSGAKKGSDDSESNEKLNDDEKAAAKIFGMSEEAWAKSKRELSYV